MAIIHKATITPTKQEVLDAMLEGPVEIVGSYRFDDPDGEVGVEAFVVRRQDELLHAVLTYRDAALADAGSRLVSTMEHSVLGPRWVYDGATDPVAVACFRRALLGEQEQAVMEIWAEGEVVGRRDSTVALTVVPGTLDDGAGVRVVRELDGADVTEGPALVARWDGGEAVVACREGDAGSVPGAEAATGPR